MTDLEEQRARRRRRGLMAVLTSSVVACGMLASTPAMASPAPKPAEPTFQDGLSQAVFTTDKAKWVRQEAWVESAVDSDGDGKNDLVHVDVTRVPETDGGLKVPVIMEMSPYYAGGSSVGNWNVDHEIGSPPTSKAGFPAPKAPSTSPKISSTWESAWVPRGFAVVHAESLGSGFSEGCPTSGAPNESQGGKAVVDWLNGRAKAFTSPARTAEVSASSWATGSVGMIGTSYNGTLPIGVASTGVQGLDAIVPVSAISDWYNYYRANGAVRAPGGYQGEDLDVLADYVHTRLPQSQCQGVINDLRAKEDRATGDRSAFWSERNYLAHPEKIKAATLVAHGLNDWNVMTKNASDLYEALKKTGTPHQIYLHQGGHGGNPSDTLLNRWFTRYLYKQQNGVENLPKAYVVRENNVLTEYADWPDKNAARATVSLGAASKANALGALRFAADTSGKKETVVDDATKRVSTLAAAAESPNRLVYRTPALTEPVRLSGTPSVSLNLSVDRPKANLTAVLLEYSATGTAKVISRGWMDVENRNSDAVTDAIEPGTFYQFNFAFEPKDYVFAKGASIGVMVISSDNEYTVRPAAGTTLTVDPAKSTVNLPIVGGVAQLAKSLGAAAPGEANQVITAEVTGGALTMSITDTDPVVLTALTLDGTDQRTTGELHPVTVRDARGTAAGWDLTAQVSDFTSANGAILAKNLGWKPSAAVIESELVGATTSVVNPGAPAQPGAGIGDAAKLCTSPKGDSAGGFTCGAGLTLGIPGSSRSGTYSAVLTLTLI